MKTIYLKDPGYPELLKKIPDPPAVLYVKGTLLEEDAAAVAIVGTRSATGYGLKAARRLAFELARRGITVVSGLAEGIDGAAHAGALEAGGRTIAVLGHGFQFLYPPQHRGLAEQVAASGALVSEFPMEMEPEKWNFPKRNRIISGLSLGVVVVEAPERSGALITARMAAEQGREVFAVPGPIGVEQSRGTHRLLKDGAKLVEEAEDVLEELTPALKAYLKKFKQAPALEEPAGVFLSEEEAALYKAVPAGAGVMAEDLARSGSWEAPELFSLLTSLELKGLLRQIPGQGYSRT